MDCRIARAALHEFLSLTNSSDTLASLTLEQFFPKTRCSIMLSHDTIIEVSHHVAAACSFVQTELNLQWRENFIKNILTAAAIGVDYKSILRTARANIDYILFGQDLKVQASNLSEYLKVADKMDKLVSSSFKKDNTHGTNLIRVL